jgi:G:T-mismatch repair DNA endonuclease (very short patch repair protein)
MKEKEIIETLLIELEVLVEAFESTSENYSQPSGKRLLDDTEAFIQALKRVGYKSYPVWEVRTPEEKQEIQDRIERLKYLGK